MGKCNPLATTFWDASVTYGAIAHANLGDAYLQLGRPREAKRAYENYLELAPGSKYATEVRQKLQKL